MSLKSFMSFNYNNKPQKLVRKEKFSKQSSKRRRHLNVSISQCVSFSIFRRSRSQGPALNTFLYHFVNPKWLISPSGVQTGCNASRSYFMYSTLCWRSLTLVSACWIVYIGSYKMLWERKYSQQRNVVYLLASKSIPWILEWLVQNWSSMAERC